MSNVDKFCDLTYPIFIKIKGGICFESSNAEKNKSEA